MRAIHVSYVPLPANKTAEESFNIDLSSHDSIICELKRRIFASQGIVPIAQRLSLEGDTDDFRIPTRVICTIRSDRRPNVSVTVSGYNQDNYKFAIDTQRDNVLDLKFLLAQCIKEKAEHVQLSINSKRYANNASIADIIQQAGVVFGDNGNARIRFWLEYASKERGHGSVHRTASSLMDIDPNFPTIAHTFRKICAQQPNDPHLGTRKFIGGAGGERGEYEWMTFQRLNERVSNVAAGYRCLGLKPRHTRLGICAANRVEWSVADHAGHTQSFITVPLYDTLAKNAIEYIINHAAVQIVICTKETLAEIVKVVDKCASLKYIVLMDDYDSDKAFVRAQRAQQNKNAAVGFTHTLSELEALGKQQPVQDVLPTPDDLATICYTSGTTGNPKGVMLTHRNLLSGIHALYARAPPEFVHGNDDAVLSYLPLAHIYQRQVEIFCLRAGARIGYFSGTTDKLLDDIQALRPTMFAGVPRVFQKIQDKTLAEVSKSNFLRRFLFNQAVAAKASSIAQGLPPPALWEKLVISKVKAKFGGRIRACLSGSAPLSVSTADFMQTCLSDLVGEGYGLTETSAAGTSTDLHDSDFGNVGTPTPSVEVKLVNVEDMNYLITDRPNPRGEIWIRGTSVFKGYFKNPKISHEVLTEDGWFATGDVGLWTEDGKLKIIDRKKNIFKLAQGEYIRPEYIENVYKMSPYIANVFVYGDSNSTFLVAIVVPDFEVISDWARNNGLASIATDASALCKNEKLLNLIRTDMDRVAKQEQLIGFEKIKRFELSAEDFSIENELLTSTMKLKRHAAKLRFKSEIEKLYQQAANSKL